MDVAGFIGVSKPSPNGEYVVVWRSGGSRSGTVALVQDEQRIWKRAFTNPNNCSVSDEGYVVVEDWLSPSRQNGAFHIMTPDGNKVVSNRFRANPHYSGITRDGRYAWIVTAHSHTEDSRQLFLYDASTGERLVRNDAPYGRIESVEKDGHLTVYTDAGVTYAFDGQGQLVNDVEVGKATDDHVLDSGNTRQLLELVERIMDEREELTDRDVDELLAILETAADRVDGKEDAPDQKRLAKVTRRRGEVLLQAGRKREALDSFHEALDQYSKVGVKRVAKKLEQELAAFEQE